MAKMSMKAESGQFPKGMKGMDCKPGDKPGPMRSMNAEKKPAPYKEPAMKK